MRLLLFVITSLLFYTLTAQVQDDFSDGDFTQNPSWTGDDADFIVNPSQRLQLDAVEAGQSYLSTAFPETPLADKEWNIWVKHSFSGSGNNFTRIYLSSTSPTLSFTGSSAAGANGYFLLFGEPGSDDAIRLFRDDDAGSSPQEIAAGTPALVAGSFELFVRVVRDADGNWEIYTDPGSGDNYQLEATGFDNTYTSSTHFGVCCTYTVSNSDKFQFDDVFFGDPELDITPPSIVNLTLLGSDQLQLNFDEALNGPMATDTDNYAVDNGVGNPSEVILGGNDDEVILIFTSPFPEDIALNLTVQGVEDLAGNEMALVVLPFTYQELPFEIFDDFEDGDFTNNPEWSGSEADFLVNDDGRLQLDAAAAGQSQLSTAIAPQLLSDKEWRFFIQQDFAGSGSNNTRFYLSANSADLSFSGSGSAGAQGYYLLFGETGSEDAIRLMRDGNEGDAPVEVCVGTPGLVASAFEVGVRVTRDSEGNWSLYADSNGGEFYQFEGSGMDNTYETSSFVGLVASYTSSNVSAFAFDDIYFGAIIPDEDPPVLLSATATSENTLTVVFNEVVDDESAQNAANFNVSNGVGEPLSAIITDDNPTEVSLTFSNAFPENTPLTLTVGQIEDPAGNTLLSAEAGFIYVVPSVAQPGDLVINELMPDPNPPIGLPDAEYLEIFNASEEVFDLEGWTLVNTTTARSLANQVLFPGEFVILCNSSDVALFESYGEVLGVDSWVALTNSADSLTLLSPDLEVIDIVSYDLSWYGDPAFSDGGISLERINPFLNCSGAFNWTAAQTFQGGTPGAQNSVYEDSPDTDAPAYTGFDFFGSNGLVVEFNEPLDPDVVDNLTYSISPDLGDASVALISNNESVRLVFDDAFEIGVPYVLSIVGISDCEGNALTEPVEIELLRGAVPEPGEIIITEIMAAPSSNVPSSPNVEYIEIYNKGSQVLELTGMNLENAALTGFALMEPGDYLVLTRESDISEFDEGIPVIGMTGFPTLTNSGRSLTLSISGETILDALTYSDAWYKDPSKSGGGYSLELINPEHPCSDIDNWRASDDPDGHTAGAQNSVYNLDPVSSLPGLQFILVTDASTIDLYFDRQLDPISVQNLNADVGIMNNGDFNSLNYDPLSVEMLNDENRAIRIVFDGGFSPGVVYHCRASGLSDCWGNAIGIDNPLSERFAVPEPHEPGDLIINEVLFNPFTDGSDFVEIYNRSSKNISISNWQLANEADGETANYRSITNLPFILFPGEYFVLTRSRFELVPLYQGTREDRIIEMTSLPSYNNGEGVVVLVDENLVVSDRVPYTEDMHYPLLRDVKGVSLERLNFERDSEDETNWHSAAESVGFATPGYENSQLSFGEQDGFLNVTPEVFSPDNDGYEDQCIIAYELPREGFTGSFNIYDDLGRFVRRVAHNVLLGTEGSVSWDGFSDDRLKAGVGIYIVFFEAFHPDGEVIQEKASVVLGHYLD